MNRFLISLILLTSAFGICYAQGQNIQPTIMVVPFTKEGEDIRTVLERDINKRATLTSIKEEFDNRGFTTIDFLGKFKANSASAAFNESNQTDLMTEVIQNSGADIYITAEINIINRADGAKSVGIILSAYDSSTGQSLANKQANAGPFKTNNIARLVDVAIKKDMDVFLDNMQGKFNDIVANGKSIVVEIGVDEGSGTLLSDEASTGNMISDEIELWMEDHAFKNYYHIAGSTEKKLLFDEVKIPLRDPNNPERPYQLNRFRMDLNKFIKSLGLNPTIRTSGNRIYVSIQ